MIKNQKFSLVVLLSILAGLIVIAVFAFLYVQKNISESESEVELIDASKLELACENIRKIDGVCYEGDEPFAYAVMIDNHSWARSPFGLSQASLVYETIVESPITRFLVIFSDNEEIKQIGPVRSARPFYVDWIKEFNIPYLHVGGSNEALDNLARTYNHDLNEFANGQYFWRSNNRSAPHNTMTSNQKVVEAFEDKGWSSQNNFESWIFKLESELEERGENGVTIDWKTPLFFIKWEYNKEANEYVRYQAGKVHADVDGEQVVAKNIAVMMTTGSVIDDYGRRKVKTLGSGEAIVYQDGQKIKGTWRRATLSERTRFYNEQEEEIQFNAGTTWIEVIQKGLANVTDKYE